MHIYSGIEINTSFCCIDVLSVNIYIDRNTRAKSTGSDLSQLVACVAYSRIRLTELLKT